ncbi:hypothetical protein SVAN01_00237 [Stagonosporopsis vannaccii]|nr:hypothetical protein SVAN01_00237 [Stagonosporopsis vannaccii]
MEKGVAVCCSEAWARPRPDQPCLLAATCRRAADTARACACACACTLAQRAGSKAGGQAEAAAMQVHRASLARAHERRRHAAASTGTALATAATWGASPPQIMAARSEANGGTWQILTSGCPRGAMSLRVVATGPPASTPSPPRCRLRPALIEHPAAVRLTTRLPHKPHTRHTTPLRRLRIAQPPLDSPLTHRLSDRYLPVHVTQHQPRTAPTPVYAHHPIIIPQTQHTHLRFYTADFRSFSSVTTSAR